MRTLKTRGFPGGQGKSELVAIHRESARTSPAQTPSHRVEIERFIELCVDALLAALRVDAAARLQTQSEEDKEEEK